MQAAAESKAAAAVAAAPTDGKKASKKAELEAKKVSSRRRLPIHCMGHSPRHLVRNALRAAAVAGGSNCRVSGQDRCRVFDCLLLCTKCPHLAPGVVPQAAEVAELQAWIDAARATPAGQKKQLSEEMPKGYAPKAVEAGW